MDVIKVRLSRHTILMTSNAGAAHSIPLCFCPCGENHLVFIPGLDHIQNYVVTAGNYILYMSFKMTAERSTMELLLMSCRL